MMSDVKARREENVTNRVVLRGVIEKEFELNHKVFGKEVYYTRLSVIRTSETEDFIPIMVPGYLLKEKEGLEGKVVKVEGECRTYNQLGNDNKSHLRVYVFVKNIIFEDMEYLEISENTNDIFLKGYLCKTPIYRVTPKGREITDIILAVNRKNGKSAYIPCIAWGRDACYIAGLNIGDEIEISGRFQSRDFPKAKDEMEEPEMKVAYEISIVDVY